MKDKQYSKFLLIWFGQFLSVVGTGLTQFSLGIFVFRLTGTASSYVAILMAAFLPPFILRPIGGILADRYDRKIMMVWGDLGASLGLLFIFIMMDRGNVQLWQIYMGIALSSIFSAFQEPAYKALITDLLSENQYDKASGLMQLASSAQYLISPFLAGFLISIMDIKYIFLIDSATLIIASAIVFIIRKKLVYSKSIKTKYNFITEFKEGIEAFLNNKGILDLVITTMFILFFVGLIQALLVPMLLNLEIAKNVGISQSISAVGMLVGSFIIGVFGTKNKMVRILAWSLFFSGVFLTGFGVSTNIIFITIAGFLFFSMLPFINTPIEVLIRKNIESDKQGRVWSIISTVTYLGSIVAFLVAGFLADKIFNPLMETNGVLAESVGSLIGVGPGRGIALLFIISGCMLSFLSIIISLDSKVSALENI